MPDIAKFLEMIQEDEEKVVKTIPIKKEWEALKNTMNEAKDELIKAKSIYAQAKCAFWAQVEEDTNGYTQQMRYNKKANEIEVFE